MTTAAFPVGAVAVTSLCPRCVDEESSWSSTITVLDTTGRVLYAAEYVAIDRIAAVGEGNAVRFFVGLTHRTWLVAEVIDLGRATCAAHAAASRHPSGGDR